LHIVVGDHRGVPHEGLKKSLAIAVSQQLAQPLVDAGWQGKDRWIANRPSLIEHELAQVRS
jgi:hypothetical protein